MTNFGKSRTIEEFKSEMKCSTLLFNYATKKDANGVNQKLFYNDAEGNPTNVQKVAVINEAGTTVAWASKEVASEIAAGKPIASDPRGLVVVDVIPDDGIARPTLLHPNHSNRIEGLSL